MSVSILQPIQTLTPRQSETLLFVGQYFARHHEMPSHAELREYLQLSAQTNVGPYLRPLFERGLLEKADASVKGRMRLTPAGVGRLKGLLSKPDAERDGQYRELKELIKQVERETADQAKQTA